MNLRVFTAYTVFSGKYPEVVFWTTLKGIYFREGGVVLFERTLYFDRPPAVEKKKKVKLRFKWPKIYLKIFQNPLISDHSEAFDQIYDSNINYVFGFT